MKEIFNTLTTKKSIRGFISDSGMINVVYYKVTCEADLYDIHNVKEIICVFGSVVTKMNKFFFNSLLSVARPNELVKCDNEVTVYFDFDNQVESVLNSICLATQKALENIDYFNDKITTVKQDKYIEETLSNRRITKKFIITLSQDKEMVECLKPYGIYLDNVLFTFDVTRQLIKSVRSSLVALNRDYEHELHYYEKELKKLYAYVG